MFPIFFAFYCLFTPPKGWEQVESKTPARHRIIGFIDKSKSGFYPSLNLNCEKVQIPTKEYLGIVQKNCSLKKQRWRYLGKIATRSGKADLTEVEVNSSFGPIRLLQVLLRREEMLYVLTAGALKKDFSTYAKEFEEAFSSLQICEDLWSLVGEDEELILAWKKKKQGITSKGFEERLTQHEELGPVWKFYMDSL